MFLCRLFAAVMQSLVMQGLGLGSVSSRGCDPTNVITQITIANVFSVIFVDGELARNNLN